MPYMNSQKSPVYNFQEGVDNEFYFHVDDDYIIRTTLISSKKIVEVYVFNSTHTIIQTF